MANSTTLLGNEIQGEMFFEEETRREGEGKRERERESERVRVCARNAFLRFCTQTRVLHAKSMPHDAQPESVEAEVMFACKPVHCVRGKQVA